MKKRCARCNSIYDPRDENEKSQPRCRWCGSKNFVDISEEEFRERLEKQARKEYCCPNPDCEPLLLPSTEKFCGKCASPLKICTIDLWFEKCVGSHRLENEPEQVFRDLTSSIEAARKIGYSEEQAIKKLDEKIRKIADQPYDVVKAWVTQVDEDLNTSFGEQSDTPNHIDFEDINAAEQKYFDFKNEEDVAGRLILSLIDEEPVIQSPKQTTIIKLREQNIGEYIAFLNSSNRREAWVFPFPNLEFKEDIFCNVFPDLDAEDYKNGNIKPQKAKAINQNSSETWLIEIREKDDIKHRNNLLAFYIEEAEKKGINNDFARRVLRIALSEPQAILTTLEPAAEPQVSSIPKIYKPPVSEPDNPVQGKKAYAIAFLLTLIFLPIIGVYIWAKFSNNTKITVVTPTPSLLQTSTPPPLVSDTLSNMILVPGGEFTMGNEEGDELSSAPHRVVVKSFYIDKYETTCAQYEKCINDGVCTNPLEWKRKICLPGQENYPVTNVTWRQADQYARWSGKRLPTEEEWEYSARYPDGRIYPWGNEWSNDAEYVSEAGLMPVGSYPQSDSDLGISDLIGNACEWTSTDLKPYPGTILPKEIRNIQLKVVRGGYWRNSVKERVKTFYRGHWLPGLERDKPSADDIEVNQNVGFRCAKSIATR